MDFIELSSQKPDGFEPDPRMIDLGMDNEHYHKPKGSFSSFPENRKFTIGANLRIKTENVKILKAEDSQKKTRPRKNIDNWLMSEKLDGLRWVWDGSHFITTSGSIPYYVPGWIRELMPPGVPLDGELWESRDGFNNITGISSTIPGKKYSLDELDLKWLGFSFNIFDVPTYKGRFKERLDILKYIVEKREDFWPKIQKKYYKILKKRSKKIAKKFKKIECPFRMVQQIEIKDQEHLESHFGNIIELGGEGLIVRDPQSFYESGKRPKIALKYKKQADAEAIVIDVLPTNEKGSRLDYMIKGPNSKEYPVMGKILCKLCDSNGDVIIENGEPIIFKIGTGFSDEFRENYCNSDKSNYYIWNPETKNGSVITFQYMEFNKDNGVPRLPRFLRIRHPI